MNCYYYLIVLSFFGRKRTLVLLVEMHYNIISRKEKGLIILREMDRNAHLVFLLYYHLVMLVKYRRKVIGDQISDCAKNICLMTAGEAPIEVIRSYKESQGEKDEQSIQVSNLSDQRAGNSDS